MKKIIILMMMLFSVTIFAEKLTTDGKDNLDKLKGKWESIFGVIINKSNKWYYIDENPALDVENKIYEIKAYKKGVFIIKNFTDAYNIVNYTGDRNLYFAYDTKYKTLVTLDKDLNIINREQRIVKCFHDKTCN